MIDKQPSVAELPGSAAQNRFNLLFQKFIEVFTTAEHPLGMRYYSTMNYVVKSSVVIDSSYRVTRYD